MRRSRLSIARTPKINSTILSRVEIDVPNNSLLPKEDKDRQICLYFSQFSLTIYTPFTSSHKNSTIKQYVENAIKANIQIFKEAINVSDSFRVYQFAGKHNPIQPDALIRWKTAVQIRFDNKSLFQKQQQHLHYLDIKVGWSHSKQNIKICLQNKKGMKIKDILQYYDLAQSYSALYIQDKIFKQNNSLQSCQFQQPQIEAVPLLPFEILYHQINSLYPQLTTNNFTYEKFVEKLANGSTSELDYLKQNMAKLRHNRTEWLIQLILIYLMSPYYADDVQKDYYREYFSNNIITNGEFESHSLTSVMIANISNLHRTDNSDTIYMIQNVQQQVGKNRFIKGQVIRLQTFCLASNQILLQNPKKDRNIYEITHITAQYIGNQTRTNKPNFVILPYSEYYVQQVKQIQGGQRISLQQIPIPRCLNSRLILWINDKQKKNKRDVNRAIKSENINTQIMYIKNNEFLQFWLQQYHTFINFRQFKIISGYSQNNEDHIKTIQLVKRKIQNDNTHILIYSNRKEQLAKNKIIQEYKNIIIQWNQNIVHKFIQTWNIKQNQFQSDHCECSKCQIS